MVSFHSVKDGESDAVTSDAQMESETVWIRLFDSCIDY